MHEAVPAASALASSLRGLPGLEGRALARSLVGLVFFGLSSWVAAQAPIPANSPSASRPALAARPAVPAKTSPKPTWEELTPAQQQALKPLSGHWASISASQKLKWIEVSRNFSSLAPAEQGKMHSHMTEWANLTPQQRIQARLNFGKVQQQLSPDEKKAKWQAYQSLSADDRQKLAAGAGSRPVGGAPAVKPVPPRKLAAVPSLPTVTEPGKPASQPQHQPKIVVAPHEVDSTTLLPQPARQP